MEDETKLQLLMEDVEAYIAETEDKLTVEESEETDQSIAEIDHSEFVSWEETKSTMK